MCCATSCGLGFLLVMCGGFRVLGARSCTDMARVCGGVGCKRRISVGMSTMSRGFVTGVHARSPTADTPQFEKLMVSSFVVVSNQFLVAPEVRIIFVRVRAWGPFRDAVLS